VASSSGAEASATLGTVSSMFNSYGVPDVPHQYGFLSKVTRKKRLREGLYRQERHTNPC
jgi:hypothetical protein